MSLRARRACLHAEVLACQRTCLPNTRYGTQAWQSRFPWDCFVALLLAMTARAGTSMKMTEIYRSIFKNIFTKNAMRNVKVAIPKLTIAISENLFQNEISLATET